MKSTKLVLLFIAFATLSLTSCKKDDPEPTKTELLTGDWNYIKQEEYINANLDGSLIITETIILTFNADHTGSTTRGNLNATSTWSFNSDETVLTISGNSGDEIYDVEKLDNSSLWLAKNETDSNGDILKQLDIFEK